MLCPARFLDTSRIAHRLHHPTSSKHPLFAVQIRRPDSPKQTWKGSLPASVPRSIARQASLLWATATQEVNWRLITDRDGHGHLRYGSICPETGDGRPKRQGLRCTRDMHDCAGSLPGCTAPSARLRSHCPEEGDDGRPKDGPADPVWPRCSNPSFLHPSGR